jgi:hypothetical protein
MSITSANSSINISVPIIYPNGYELQRFSTDDIYSAGQVRRNITKMGVDGYQSAGKVWVSRSVTYHFQPDSPSCDFFDVWGQTEDQLNDTLIASGLIVLPGIQKKFTMVRGALGECSPIPGAGQTLKERTFEVVWNLLIPAPYTGI